MAGRSKKRSPEQNPFDDFAGFDDPRYTQIPDQFLEQHVPFLNGGEIKIMLVLFRETLGRKKRSAKLSAADIGVRSGLAKSTVNTAVGSLEEKGLILVQRQATADGGADANTYTVNYR